MHLWYIFSSLCPLEGDIAASANSVLMEIPPTRRRFPLHMTVRISAYFKGTGWHRNSVDYIIDSSCFSSFVVEDLVRTASANNKYCANSCLL